jgi:DinB superfamily
MQPTTQAAVEETLAQLQATQARLTEVLTGVADRQDWRPAPEEWSFREIAAHLDVTQRECVLARVVAIASGSRPQFEYYRNTGRDFGPVDLRDSLRGFAETRQAIHVFARGLSPEQLGHTGTHQTFGEITVHDYLKLDLEHDEGHLRDLERSLQSTH